MQEATEKMKRKRNKKIVITGRPLTAKETVKVLAKENENLKKMVGIQDKLISLLLKALSDREVVRRKIMELEAKSFNDTVD